MAFDLETTGLSPSVDRIIEVGAVAFDRNGREHGRFESLVRPGRPVSPGARRVHGIGDAELADAPPASAVLPHFLDWLGDPGPTVLLAHNAPFDCSFLGAELRRCGLARPAHRVIDTLPMARRLVPDAPSHRLDSLAGRLHLDPSTPHRALADSLRVRGLWLALAGPDVPPASLVCYSIAGHGGPPEAPLGWDDLVEAIAGGRRIRMAYSGGSRGLAPREITPRRIRHLGGVAYVVALCHLDGQEKSFRLDRVVSYEVMAR